MGIIGSKMSLVQPDTITVVCDECGDEVEVDTEAYCGNGMMRHSFGIDGQLLIDQGWIADGDDHYCPKCKEDKDE